MGPREQSPLEPHTEVSNTHANTQTYRHTHSQVHQSHTGACPLPQLVSHALVQWLTGCFVRAATTETLNEPLLKGRSLKKQAQSVYLGIQQWTFWQDTLELTTVRMTHRLFLLHRSLQQVALESRLSSSQLRNQPLNWKSEDKNLNSSHSSKHKSSFEWWPQVTVELRGVQPLLELSLLYL